MKQVLKHYFAVALSSAFLLNGCGSDSDGPSAVDASETPNLVVMTRIDDTTGFMVTVDTENDSSITNANGVELNPATGIFAFNNAVYTTGSRYSDKLKKYTFNGSHLVLQHEVVTGENTLPGSFYFVDETKAYVNLDAAAELLVVDPSDLSITRRIDLSPYALGENDTNPEPSSMVIRDGKLFLALAQIDSFDTWRCQAGASVLIIDIATDTVESHIQDSRACSSGTLEPNDGLILDENGDIYVNHLGAYGYYPGLVSGFLRIRNGETDFDPDYFFSITDLDLPGVPGSSAAYSYREAYGGNGMVYTNLMVPGMTSNPPDYANDKNYLAYRLDLYNQTATPLEMPATAGWSADIVKLVDHMIFGRLTDTGSGLYRFDTTSTGTTGDSSPFLTTEGSPVWIIPYQ